MKHTFSISVLLLTFAFNANAQTTVLNRIPLNKSIEVTLLGVDDGLLYCYNLYGFNYYDGTDSLMGEFLVLKDADTFQEKINTHIKLCRVKEFSVQVGKACRSIKVGEGMQIRHKGQSEPLYFNFDPLGPEPVFIPCK